MSGSRHSITTAVCVLSLTFNVSLGSEVTLTASTPAIQPPLTPIFNLRCSFDDTASSTSVVGRSLSATPTNVKFVSSMFLFKDNEDIATVSEHTQAHAVNNAQNLNVSGAIPGSGPGEKGFLEVSMSYPTESQGGNYTCRISTIDDVGHLVIFSKSVVVHVTSPTINDMVQYLLSEDQKNRAKIASLESLIKIQDEKNQIQDKAIKVQDQMIYELKDELNVTRHVEGGVVSCGGNLGNIHNAQQFRSTAVTFTDPYRHAPLVHVAVHDAGINKDSHNYFHVKLLQVDGQGFTVECSALPFNSVTHYLSYLQLSWLSFPVSSSLP